MKKLLAIFTSNWGLKILALVLAVVVYYSMKETTRSNRHGNRPNTPIFLKGPADGGK